MRYSILKRFAVHRAQPRNHLSCILAIFLFLLRVVVVLLERPACFLFELVKALTRGKFCKRNKCLGRSLRLGCIIAALWVVRMRVGERRFEVVTRHISKRGEERGYVLLDIAEASRCSFMLCLKYIVPSNSDPRLEHAENEGCDRNAVVNQSGQCNRSWHEEHDSQSERTASLNRINRANELFVPIRELLVHERELVCLALVNKVPLHKSRDRTVCWK